MTPGPLQILLIILVIVLLFGASRVPAIAENLAKGIKAFKRGIRDDDGDKPKVSDKTGQDDEMKG